VETRCVAVGKRYEEGCDILEVSVEGAVMGMSGVMDFGGEASGVCKGDTFGVGSVVSAGEEDAGGGSAELANSSGCVGG